MFGLLFLAFLLVPIAELYLFVRVADAIGFGSTLFWIVGVSVIGAWLVKYEGLGVLRRANAAVTRGQLPTNELINGILILFAGALMLTPGFLTDAFGLTLLFPPTRALYRTWLRSRFAAGPIVIGPRGFSAGLFGSGDPGDVGFGRGPTTGRSHPGGPGAAGGDVWDVPSWEDPPGDDPRALE